MTRLRLWLTPATVVIAVALAAVTAGYSLRGVGTIRGWLAAPAPAASPQPMYTVPGSIRLPAGQYTAQGRACRGTELDPDSQIVISDPSGAALTFVPLSAGVVTADKHCQVAFTLVMPAGKGTYTIDYPLYGQQPYTEQQIADLLSLTIG